MIINENISYSELNSIYDRFYSLGYLNVDINTKFAFIALTGYLVYKLKQKKPDITTYQVLRKIVGLSLPDDFIKGASIVIDDFSYGCTAFPTFGIEDKNIPAKIKDILSNYVPF